MASLMRRAVQQAKAEAAAAKVQVPETEGQGAVVNTQPSKPAGGDKRALASMLIKVAQKMQQQEAAVQSESISSGPSSLQASELDTAPDAGLIEAEQPQAQAAGKVQLFGISAASSTGATELLALPKEPPERNQSLGERLGAILRGALSLPRQSSYVPMAADDDETDQDAAARFQLPPVNRRALPRDASYLPEWLTRTLSSSPGNSGSDDGLEAQDLLQEQAEDADELPQWVDWSTMQLKEEAPVKRRPTPQALPTDRTPFIEPLVDSQPAASQAPTGRRLFEFWQQKSEAVATSSVGSEALAPSLPPAHARRSQASAQKLTAETVLYDAATRRNMGATQQQLQLDKSHEAAAGLALQDVVLPARHVHSARAELAAELAATSQLVQQQSLRQAELLEGLEHALSQISQHRLLIQNPAAQLEPSESVAEAQTGVVSAYLEGVHVTPHVHGEQLLENLISPALLLASWHCRLQTWLMKGLQSCPLKANSSEDLGCKRQPCCVQVLKCCWVKGRCRAKMRGIATMACRAKRGCSSLSLQTPILKSRGMASGGGSLSELKTIGWGQLFFLMPQEPPLAGPQEPEGALYCLVPTFFDLY